MSDDRAAVARLVEGCSLEITPRDRSSLEVVTALGPPGTEVFIADLPDQPADVVLDAAVALRRAGLHPVPHLVARNIDSAAPLAWLLARLSGEAGVDRALVLSGDRETPVGGFEDGVALIRTGLLQRHGLARVALACFPEGHPRLDGRVLEHALFQKLAAAEAAGLAPVLVTQFAFDARPVLSFCARLREKGVSAPLRIGVAGPAPRETLAAFGADLGAGRSLNALKARCAEGPKLVETPAAILQQIARAREHEPALAIEGVHFFPFGETDACLRWANARRRS